MISMSAPGRRSAAGAAAFVLFALSLAAASPARARLFEPETFTLGNGLQVVVVSDRRVPVVSHMVWYKVGAADEVTGSTGIAHLLEHLMFKGTPEVPQGEFSRQIARNGGQENAFTSHDYTAYFQNIARDRLELAMRMEADRMTGLTLTEAQVTPEKMVVLEERRQRVDNDPGAILGEETQAARFIEHPYRRPVIGWEKDIAGLSASEVLAFYRRWYAPNNAILVVSGDVSAEELRPMAERTYGKVPRGTVPARNEIAEPAQRAERNLSLQDPRVGQPAWTRSWRAPSYGWGASADAYPLQVLEEILSGGAVSRVYRILVVEHALADSAGAWYDPSRRGPSGFVMHARPREGVSLDRVEQAVESLLEGLLRDGVTDAELERAKAGLTAGAVYARDSYTTAARSLGESLAIGQSIDDVEAWPDRIKAVTREQVDAAARAVFRQPAVTSRLIATEGAVARVAGAPAVPTGAEAIR